MPFKSLDNIKQASVLPGRYSPPETESKINGALTVLPQQVPMFLIPDISGKTEGLVQLANELAAMSNGMRPIHLYQDPRAAAEEVFETKPTLQEQVDAIVSGVMNCNLGGGKTCILIGYSYGCTLGGLAAIELKKRGYDPHFIAIDGPSPTLSRDYFATNNDSVTNDVIAILNYVAQLYRLTPVTFKEADVNKLSLKRAAISFEEWFNKIANRITEKQVDVGLNTMLFTVAKEVVKQNLANLMTCEIDVEPAEKLARITVLMTNKTIQKYAGQPKGGWDEFASEVLAIPVLSDKEHTHLLADENKATVAAAITDAVDNNPELTEKSLLRKLLQAVADKAQDPEVRLAASTTVRRLSPLHSSGHTPPLPSPLMDEDTISDTSSGMDVTNSGSSDDEQPGFTSTKDEVLAITHTDPVTIPPHSSYRRASQANLLTFQGNIDKTSPTTNVSPQSGSIPISPNRLSRFQ